MTASPTFSTAMLVFLLFLSCGSPVPLQAPNVVKSSAPRSPVTRAIGEEPTLQVVCGREPDSQTYRWINSPGAEAALGKCQEKLEAGLTRAQRVYLQESSAWSLPKGFGLEDTAVAACLTPSSPLRSFLKVSGVCSDLVMATVVLGTCRSSSPELSLGAAVRTYYASEAKDRWQYVSGDGLPATILRDRHGQAFPSEYRSVVEFLEHLATSADPTRTYRPTEVGDIDAGFIGEHISKKEIKLNDANWRGPIVAGPERVLQELRKRSGAIFVALSQLGYRYSEPYPQSSHLAFSATVDGEAIVSLPETYELTFEKDQGMYRLRALNQTMEADR